MGKYAVVLYSPMTTMNTLTPEKYLLYGMLVAVCGKLIVSIIYAHSSKKVKYYLMWHD